MSDCTCPYCKKEMEDPDEAYEPDVLYEEECHHCEKAFVFYVDYIKIFKEYKADCLNGDKDHEFKITSTYPKWASRLRCTMCGLEKALPEGHEFLKDKPY